MNQTNNFNFSHNTNQNPYLINTSFNQTVNYSWNSSNNQNGFSSNFL